MSVVALFTAGVPGFVGEDNELQIVYIQLFRKGSCAGEDTDAQPAVLAARSLLPDEALVSEDPQP